MAEGDWFRGPATDAETMDSFEGRAVPRRRFPLLTLCLLILVVAACEFPADAVEVFNASSQTVELVQESGDTRISLTKLRPGMGYTTRQECVTDFVVLSLAGEELARPPGPFCQGEPEWVITDEMLQEG